MRLNWSWKNIIKMDIREVDLGCENVKCARVNSRIAS
jgi:hypothetical protein